MKNSILIFCALAATLSLTAFGYISWSYSIASHEGNLCLKTIPEATKVINKSAQLVYPDFFYDFGTRFSPVKKDDLIKAKSIHDFLPEDETNRVLQYESVSVILIRNDKQSDIRIAGRDDVLTYDQTNLLRSLPYSTNFLIRSDYVQQNESTGALEHTYSTPHLTIVPTKQASYLPGKDALLEYLRKNNYENTANLDQNKLQPAKLYFTVNKDGAITNLRLDRTSGFPIMDDTMIALVKELPGSWEPAENADREKVDQEFVISFGMVGC